MSAEGRAPLAPALLAAALLLAASPGAAGENPHAFMADPARCEDCHLKTPERGRDDYTTVTFKDSIVSLCSGCHQGDHFREMHPVEIRPEDAVPEDLHLDNFYTVTCATCHDPHGPHESDRAFVPQGFRDRAAAALRPGARHRTYFLRRPNAGGELCAACHPGGAVAADREGAAAPGEGFLEFVGSEKCRECHPALYEAWRLTLHARNFRDAKRDPGAIRGVFVGDEPFPPGDVLWTVGEHWTQRYLVQGKKELMVVPDTWSLQAGTWMKEGSFPRPWLRYCAGCHVTALNPFDGRFLEPGTGCEGCHGPGRRHAESTDQSEIVNPAVLVQSRRDMVCESCHTAGHDRSGNFRYPVGFRPGEDLMRTYRGLVPKPGQDTANYKGDGTYEDRHRQFEFWISRLNILVGTTCDICSAHRRPAQGMESAGKEYRLSPDEMCGTCHRDIKKDQRAHSGHDPARAGCLDCHPPLVAGDGRGYSIHDHKFQFGPARPEHLAGGDPCEGCHERRRVRKLASRPGRAAP